MPERVTVGRIIKPHGLRGEVVVDVWSDVPGRFDAGTTFDTPTGVGPAGIDPVHPPRLTVASSRPHQGRLLVTFTEIDDRNAAELLRGLELEAEPVDTSDSPYLFVSELLGRPVRDEEGVELGHVRDVIELPTAAGYELLEVERADGTTWLLPAVDEYLEVEIEDDGLMLRLVDPPAGLVDGTAG